MAWVLHSKLIGWLADRCSTKMLMTFGFLQRRQFIFLSVSSALLPLNLEWVIKIFCSLFASGLIMKTSEREITFTLKREHQVDWISNLRLGLQLSPCNVENNQFPVEKQRLTIVDAEFEIGWIIWLGFRQVMLYTLPSFEQYVGVCMKTPGFPVGSGRHLVPAGMERKVLMKRLILFHETIYFRYCICPHALGISRRF